MPERARRAIVVKGVVQGVGFRPFVYEVATALQLSGFVRNRTGSVEIEVEGAAAAIDDLVGRLRSRPPPLARVESVDATPLPLVGESGFRIESSQRSSSADVAIAADVATCADCLRELLDPRDRRAGYAFVTCTHCGPRLTVIQAAPYDRAQTTMAGFPLCADCQREYDDPADRRFHAQTLACPACGPRLTLRDRSGAPLDVSDPIAATTTRLLRGEIGALKAIGGYHLACDARSRDAVEALRARKHREHKPFAILVAAREAAERLATLTPADGDLLASAARPIVLVPRRAESGLPAAVSPTSSLIGLMLPSSPLQHLLVRAVGDVPLVMTSGNRSGEPIAFRDDDAIAQLGDIADFFLTHDRAIQVRCDDSVARVIAGVPTLIRRARGYAPLPLRLPYPLARPTLALGGHLKSTFALGRGDQVFVSPHLGDLDDYEVLQAYRALADHFVELFQVRPERFACDLHPDYATTRLARELADPLGAEVIEVQHHRAHIAGALAESQVVVPAIGFAFDGLGYGADGTLWGGEIFHGAGAALERVGTLMPVGMPGGERAAEEGWRMAVAHLRAAGLDPIASLAHADEAIDASSIERVVAMLDRRVATPLTSSVGRLFDAVAALIGGPRRNDYEGHAAAWLESQAARAGPVAPYPVDLCVRDGLLVIDSRGWWRALAEELAHGVAPRILAGRFHASLAAAVQEVARRLRAREGTSVVALSGGVFVNDHLTVEIVTRLTSDGFQVCRHRHLPPGDGGLSWGQLAAVAYRDAAGR